MLRFDYILLFRAVDMGYGIAATTCVTDSFRVACIACRQHNRKPKPNQFNIVCMQPIFGLTWWRAPDNLIMISTVRAQNCKTLLRQSDWVSGVTLLKRCQVFQLPKSLFTFYTSKNVHARRTLGIHSFSCTSMNLLWIIMHFVSVCVGWWWLVVHGVWRRTQNTLGESRANVSADRKAQNSIS